MDVSGDIIMCEIRSGRFPRCEIQVRISGARQRLIILRILIPHTTTRILLCLLASRKYISNAIVSEKDVVKC
jgi:hypothetical protein